MSQPDIAPEDAPSTPTVTDEQISELHEMALADRDDDTVWLCAMALGKTADPPDRCAMARQACAQQIALRAIDRARDRPDAVTGETITTEQIRELWDKAAAVGDVRLVTACFSALQGFGDERVNARQACAEAHNETL